MFKVVWIFENSLSLCEGIFEYKYELLRLLFARENTQSRDMFWNTQVDISALAV